MLQSLFLALFYILGCNSLVLRRCTSTSLSLGWVTPLGSLGRLFSFFRLRPLGNHRVSKESFQACLQRLPHKRPQLLDAALHSFPFELLLDVQELQQGILHRLGVLELHGVGLHDCRVLENVPGLFVVKVRWHQKPFFLALGPLFLQVLYDRLNRVALLDQFECRLDPNAVNPRSIIAATKDAQVNELVLVH